MWLQNTGSLQLLPWEQKCLHFTAGKARLHQLSSGMRRTVSLEAIIGPYLQGQWPKEHENQSSPSHHDKSTQVSIRKSPAPKNCKPCFFFFERKHFFFLFFCDTIIFHFFLMLVLWHFDLKYNHRAAHGELLHPRWAVWGLQMKKLQGCRKQGVTSFCTAIAALKLQPWELSADEDILAAPILSALFVQALATAHHLPTSSLSQNSCLSVSPALLFVHASVKAVLWVCIAAELKAFDFWQIKCGVIV